MTRATTLSLAAAAALLTLTACGTSDKVSTSDGPPSLASLADTIGCSDVKPDKELVGVREGGSCDMGGSTVYLYTYSTDDQQKSLHKVTRLGGGVWVVGDRWEAQTDGQGVASKVADATGGEVE